MKNQQFKILPLIVYCLLLMGCNGQKKENDSQPIGNVIVIKKLDSSYLDTIKAISRKDQKIQLIEKDSVVELTDQGDTYLERRRKNNESIYNYFVYDKKNHLMTISGTSFYDIPIGIFRRYNEYGETVEEVNRDKNYAFSVYDLIEKIKVTHQIDLNTTAKITDIEKAFDNSANKYFYMIRYKDEKGTTKFISIDGQTGKILAEGVYRYNVICPVR